MNLHVIIPAAGMGTRLGARGAEPKSLLPVHGQPMLVRTLASLRDAGLERATIVLGYGAARVRRALAPFETTLRLDYALNRDYAITEHGYSLFLACDAWAEQSLPVLMIDADNVFEPALLARLLDQPAPDCVLVDPTLDTSASDEELVLGRGGRVTGFVRGRGHDFPDHVGAFVGMSVFSPGYMERLFELMRGLFEREGRGFKYERVFHRLASEHAIAPMYLDTGGLGWVNVNSAPDLERARRLLDPHARDASAPERSGSSSLTFSTT